MAKVSTVLDKQARGILPQYAEGIKELSMQFGQSTKSLTDAMYDILSSGIEPSKAMYVLGASGKAAVAGLTDAKTAAEAIVYALNSYQMSASQATYVSDILFQTVRYGVINFKELADNMGKILAIGATSKISLEDLSATLAVLTKAGFKSEFAITALKAIIATFGRHAGPEATKIAKKFGIELSGAYLAGNGLIETMKKLKDATIDELYAIFPNIRATGGVAATTNQWREAVRLLIEMMNSTGATQDAFTERAKAAQFQIDQLKASINVLLTEVGYDYLDWLKGVVGKLTNATKALRELRKEHSELASIISKAAGWIEIIFVITGAFATLSWTLRKLGIITIVKETFKGLFHPVSASAKAMGLFGTAVLTVNVAMAGFKVGEILQEKFPKIKTTVNDLIVLFQELKATIVFSPQEVFDTLEKERKAMNEMNKLGIDWLKFEPKRGEGKIYKQTAPETPLEISVAERIDKENADAFARKAGLVGLTGDALTIYENFLDELRTLSAEATIERMDDLTKEIYEAEKVYDAKVEFINNIEGIENDARKKAILLEEAKALLTQKILTANTKDEQKIYEEKIRRIEDELSRLRQVADMEAQIEDKMARLLMTSLEYKIFQINTEADAEIGKIIEIGKENIDELIKQVNEWRKVALDALKFEGWIQFFDDIKSAWSSTIETFILEGGKIKDFFNSLKVDVLNIWAKMLAEMVAKQMAAGLQNMAASVALSMFNIVLPKAAAHGANFMTSGPTLMMVGEAGSEHVQVTPSGQSSGGNVTVNVINQGAPVEVTQQEQFFNGDQMFVNMYIRNLQRNPNMRAAVRGVM